MRFSSRILIALLAAIMASCGSTETKVDQNAPQVQTNSSKNLAAEGKLAVETAQKELKTNLVGAIKKGGPVGAIKFCNLEATGIMAEMSKNLNVTIKRVSTKNRNPGNSPSELDQTALEIFQKELKKGVKKIEGRIVESKNGEAAYYAPIMTGAVCLTCHGAKENLAPAVASTLTELYPNDLALGYSVGDLRGAWVVASSK